MGFAKDRREKNIAKAIEMYDSGMKISEITKELDLCKNTIANYVRTGRKLGRDKKVIDAETIDKINELYYKYESASQAAKELDLSEYTIYKYIKNGVIKPHEDKIKGNESKIIELLNKGYTDTEVSEELDISYSTISNFRRSKTDIICNKTKASNLKAEIIEAYKDGFTHKQIREKFNVSSGHVINTVRGVKRIKGEKHTRMTEELESTILKLYNNGISIKDISSQLNIHNLTISRALRKHECDIRTIGSYKKNSSDLVLQVYLTTNSINQTAKKLNIGYNTAKENLIRAGIEFEDLEYDKYRDNIVEVYNRTHNLRKVSEELGIKYNIVREQLIKAGLL